MRSAGGGFAQPTPPRTKSDAPSVFERALTKPSLDPALPRYAAVLPDRALTLPVLAGAGGTKGIHPLGWRAGCGTQQSAPPWGLPAQPVDRLPARLRALPGLRVGAGHRGRVPPDPQHAPGARPQLRPCRRNADRGADLRAIFRIPRLS